MSESEAFERAAAAYAVAPSAAAHQWVPSTLGHGEAMCRRCWITNREAAVLGLMAHCDGAAPDEGEG